MPSITVPILAGPEEDQLRLAMETIANVNGFKRGRKHPMNDLDIQQCSINLLISTLKRKLHQLNGMVTSTRYHSRRVHISSTCSETDTKKPIFCGQECISTPLFTTPTTKVLTILPNLNDYIDRHLQTQEPPT